MNSARRAKGLTVCAVMAVFLAGASIYHRLGEVSDAADYARSAADDAASKAGDVDSRAEDLEGRLDDVEGRVASACEAHYC